MPILGTTPDAIDLAEDRDRFQQLLHRLELAPAAQRHRQIGRRGAPDRRRASAIPSSSARPMCSAGAPWRSYATTRQLERYMARGGGGLGQQPGADRPLSGRRHRGRCRCPLATARDVFVAGIMEHIEEAGIHSGDSACSLPPYSLSRRTVAELERQTARAGAGAERRRPDECPISPSRTARSTSSRSIRAPRAPCPSSPR